MSKSLETEAKRLIEVFYGGTLNKLGSYHYVLAKENAIKCCDVLINHTFGEHIVLQMYPDLKEFTTEYWKSLKQQIKDY